MKVDPRNNSGRHRHTLAADRITIGRDSRFERGNPAERQRRHVFEEIRRCHIDHREIAIVRHEADRGRIFVRIALAFDGEVTTVTHDVRVGHDAVAIDDKSGANAALDAPEFQGAR